MVLDRLRTMATLTTRILRCPRSGCSSPLLLALGVPCSAQLGVHLRDARTRRSRRRAGLGRPRGRDPVPRRLPRRPRHSGGELELRARAAAMRRPQLMNIVVKTLARVEWYLRERCRSSSVGHPSSLSSSIVSPSCPDRAGAARSSVAPARVAEEPARPSSWLPPPRLRGGRVLQAPGGRAPRSGAGGGGARHHDPLRSVHLPTGS